MLLEALFTLDMQLLSMHISPAFVNDIATCSLLEMIYTTNNLDGEGQGMKTLANCYSPSTTETCWLGRVEDIATCHYCRILFTRSLYLMASPVENESI